MKTFVRVTGFPYLAAVQAKPAAGAGDGDGDAAVLPCWSPPPATAPREGLSPWPLPNAHRLYGNANNAYGNRDAIIVIITANAA